MANILFISYDGMTDPLGQSQVIPYLIGLQKKGHSIDILSTEKENNFLQKEYQIQDLLKNNKINWHTISYTKKPPVVSTLLDVKKLWKKTKALHKARKFEVIHCRSYISALFGLKMKNKFNTKFVFDMRGFYADERVDGKMWDLKNPIYKAVYNYFKKKEIEFLENADAIISLTNNAKNKILKWSNISNQPLPISVIPCCVDMDRFDPSLISKEQTLSLKKDLGINESDFVLSYLGSIGTWYMLDEMLDFFKQLLVKEPNSKFLFITGESSEYILSEATKKNIDLAKFIIKKADYTEVPKYLTLSDFALFFILPVFSKSASSPVKQGEIMSMGIPIVCNSGVGDTDFVIKKYECGLLVNAFDEKEYKGVIDEMFKAKFNSDKIRNAADDFYSLEKGIESYNNAYKISLK